MKESHRTWLSDVFGLAFALALLLCPQGVQAAEGPPPPPLPPPPPPPTVICRIIVIGDAVAAATASPWRITNASIHCRRSSDESNVHVHLGSRLLLLVSAQPQQAAIEGATGATGAAPAAFSGVTTHHRSTGLEDDDDDWGITFRDVLHLQLEDSFIARVPLSAIGPLLQCLNCTYLTANNLTMKHLYGEPSPTPPLPPPPTPPPPPPSPPSHRRVHGALHMRGVCGADLHQLECSNVMNAHGWSCVLLELCMDGGQQEASARTSVFVHLRGSAFTANTVVWQLPTPSYGVIEGEALKLGDNLPPLAPMFGSLVLLAQPPAGPDAQDSHNSMVDVVLTDSALDGNSGGFGAAIAIIGLTNSMVDVQLVNSTISNNFAQLGAAVASSGGLSAVSLLNGSIIESNEAREGGAIWVKGKLGPLLVSDHSSISANAAEHGGAVCARQGSSVVVQGSSYMDNNYATESGGAAYFGASLDTLTVDDHSSMSNNEAHNQNGGAVYVQQSLGSVTVSRGSHLDYNKAYGQGGALFVGGDNIANTNTSVFFVTDASSVDGNSASFNASSRSSGGAFFSRMGVELLVVTNNSSVTNNSAAWNGGAFSVQSLGGFILTNTSHMSGNQAGGNGGACYVDNDLGRLLVTNGSSMRHNTALTGAGGAVCVKKTLGGLLLSNGSSIDSNSAHTGGGGLHVEYHVLTNITVLGDSSINNNSVSIECGGGIRIGGDLPALVVTQGSSISWNMAFDNGTASGGMQQAGAVWVGGVLGELIVSHRSSMNWNTARKGGSLLWMGGAKSNDSDVRQVTQVTIHNGSCICNNTGGTAEGANEGALVFNDRRIARIEITESSCLCGNRVPKGDGRGGAIHISDGIDVFTICNNSEMSDNMGGHGGAVYIHQEDNSKLALGNFTLCGSSKVDNNIARTHAGAFWVEGRVGHFSSYNSSMSGNNALIDGGFLYMTKFFGLLVIQDSLVCNNTAGFGQGGYLRLYVSAEGPTQVSTWVPDGPFHLLIERSTISYNKALKNGGAFYISTQLYIVAVNDSLELHEMQLAKQLLVNITNSTFEQNRAGAGAGGALSLINILAHTQTGLAAVNLGLTVCITGSHFRANRAGDEPQGLPYVEEISALTGYGGAIFLWAKPYLLYEPTPTAQTSNADQASMCGFTTGSAEGALGAMDIMGFNASSSWPLTSFACRLEMKNTRVYENNGAGSGGGVLVANCGARISNSQFHNNTCARKGGGLAFMDYGLPLVAFQSTTAAGPCKAGAGESTTAPSPSPASNVVLFPVQMRRIPWPWFIIQSTSVVGNTAVDGGGILLEVNMTTAFITNCSLLHNQAAGLGGGLSLVANSTLADLTLTVVDTLFSNNQGSHGGALSVSLAAAGTGFVLWKSQVSHNSATVGGGLYSQGVMGTVLIALDSELVGNIAYRDGAGLAFAYTAPAHQGVPNQTKSQVAIIQISLCSLTGNVAGFDGGGAWFSVDPDVHVMITTTTLAANKASQGGGLYLDASRRGNVQLNNCSVSNNTAYMHGGGAYVLGACGGGQLVVSNSSSFSANRAERNGGGIASFRVLRAGGVGQDYGINVYGSTMCAGADLELDNTNIVANEASLGGGLYLNLSSSAFIRSSTLSSNTVSQSGGALAAVMCGLLILSNCNITRSHAQVSGGGIYADMCWLVLIERSQLSHNSASAGGGVHLAGAASSVHGIGLGVAPVALLSQVNIMDNVAVGIRENVIATAGGNNPSEYQQYRGYGGGVLITGHLGLAVSRSWMNSGNLADVGTALATTQACLHPSNTSTGQQQDVSPLMPFSNSTYGQWLLTWTYLQRAVHDDCALLILSDSKFSTVPGSPDQMPVEVGSSRPAVEGLALLSVPPLWLYDLTASSLQAQCSKVLDVNGTRDTSSSPAADGSSDQQASTQTRSQAPQELTYEEGRVIGVIKQQWIKDDMSAMTATLPKLQGMLQECSDEGGVAVAVPGTHLRVTGVSGMSVISSSTYSENLSTTHVPTDQAGVQLTSSLVPGNEVLALLITPSTPFDLTVQLFDGLGQPVVADIPSHLVKLAFTPVYMHGGAMTPIDSEINSIAWLSFSPGNIGTLDTVTTRGVATWEQLMILGWPGLYKLEVTAASVTNTTLQYKVQNLSILVELLACEVGMELVPPQQHDTLSSWTGCSSCRKGRLGLWTDTRPRLAQLLDAKYKQSMEAFSADLLTLVGNDYTECIPCPAGAVCPGNALVVPQPGFWHSSANSPLIHRCPRPQACGGSSVSGGHWEQMLAVFGSQHATLWTMPDSLSTAAFIDLNLSLSDNRSLVLGLCQQWWQSYFPLQQMLVAQLYGATNNTSKPRCTLWGSTPVGESELLSYMDMQCLTGYTGNLCATCEAGFSLSGDFECNRCPTTLHTISLGLLSFFGTVVLILYTTFSNLGQGHTDAMAAHTVSSLDVLKVFITHIQYFTIITRLNIDYPAVISRCQSALSAMTGAENYITYSPSCAFPDLGGAGQAAVQVVYGFAMPCMAAMIASAFWALRYAVTNQRRFWRSTALQREHTSFVATSQLSESPAASTTTTHQASLDWTVRSPGGQESAVLITLAVEHTEHIGSTVAPTLASEVQVEGASSCDNMAAAHPHLGLPVDPSAESEGHMIESGTRMERSGRIRHRGLQTLSRDVPSPTPSIGSAESGELQPAGCCKGQHASRSLVHADQSLSLTHQLEVVAIVAAFILYPSLCQTSLSMFACNVIDSGIGAFTANQKATWVHGYWLRNMEQQCYDGVHRHIYMPVGVASVMIFSLGIPLVFFILTWRSRLHFEELFVQIKYGFLYQQYRPRFFWWAAVLQLQTLSLVAAEAFGRTMEVLQQATLLLVVLIMNAAVTMTCSPFRFRLVMLLEFLSSAVLSMTIALSLSFLDDLPNPLSTEAAAAIGVIILALNSAILGIFLYFVLQHSSISPNQLVLRAWGAVSLVSSMRGKLVTSLRWPSRHGGSPKHGPHCPPLQQP